MKTTMPTTAEVEKKVEKKHRGKKYHVEKSEVRRELPIVGSRFENAFLLLAKISATER